MIGWLEILGVLLLGLTGVLLGHWFGKIRSGLWMAGYFVPLLLICAIGLARRFPVLETIPPFDWLMGGRREFAWTALLAAMLLTTPMSRLTLKRTRIAVWTFMGLVIANTAVLPFLAPALNRDYLASLKTNFDKDGICIQSNDYTCGPAAAVTALRYLNFSAEEGELAILARTSRFTGSEPDMLQAALRKRYGQEGLVCEYRHFKSVRDLTSHPLVLARIKFGLLVDHWVTVLQVDESTVTVADPFRGKRQLSHEEFADVWRFCGLILSRGSPSSTH